MMRTSFPQAPMMLALVAVVLAPSLMSGQAPKGAGINLAEARFRLGRFSEAEEIAARVLAADPVNFRAVMIHARVALLANRLADAEAWAAQATEIRPTHQQPKQMLAEISYRRDEFAKAAELYKAIGTETRALQLASFETRRPYSRGKADSRVELPFIQTDPLPVVLVEVNGSEPAAFIIDTGAAEVIVDTQWAAEIGIESLANDTGTFAAGREVPVGYGRADSLTLGSLELRDVPVQLLDTTLLADIAAEWEIRGVLGTVLLYHFVATIDYPGGKLLLEPRGTDTTSTTNPPLARIPFLLAGDRYILAAGSANDADSSFFLVDTGLAGLGFTCPRSTLDRADVSLMPTGPSQGVGRASTVQVVPFVLESLSLGSLRREQIPGAFGPFPSTLEHNKGFRIGGLISHGFFRPYAVTFDFDAMELIISSPS